MHTKPFTSATNHELSQQALAISLFKQGGELRHWGALLMRRQGSFSLSFRYGAALIQEVEECRDNLEPRSSLAKIKSWIQTRNISPRTQHDTCL